MARNKKVENIITDKRQYKLSLKEDDLYVIKSFRYKAYNLSVSDREKITIRDNKCIEIGEKIKNIQESHMSHESKKVRIVELQKDLEKIKILYTENGQDNIFGYNVGDLVSKAELENTIGKENVLYYISNNVLLANDAQISGHEAKTLFTDVEKMVSSKELQEMKIVEEQAII